MHTYLKTFCLFPPNIKYNKWPNNLWTKKKKKPTILTVLSFVHFCASLTALTTPAKAFWKKKDDRINFHFFIPFFLWLLVVQLHLVQQMSKIISFKAFVIRQSSGMDGRKFILKWFLFLKVFLSLQDMKLKAAVSMVQKRVDLATMATEKRTGKQHGSHIETVGLQTAFEVLRCLFYNRNCNE